DEECWNEVQLQTAEAGDHEYLRIEAEGQVGAEVGGELEREDGRDRAQNTAAGKGGEEEQAVREPVPSGVGEDLGSERGRDRCGAARLEGAVEWVGQVMEVDRGLPGTGKEGGGEEEAREGARVETARARAGGREDGEPGRLHREEDRGEDEPL